MSKLNTDGDGYWDGWIGVYGVGKTENVILYRDRLEKQGSVSGQEAVPQQAGVHDVAAAPSEMSVDVTGGSEKEHSNIHIGELQWETNPTKSWSQPDPHLTVEVDFYAKSNYSSLDTVAWERGIERNYALYDIEVDILRDQVLNDYHFYAMCANPHPLIYCVNPQDGFGYSEIISTGTMYQSESVDEYILVAQKAGGNVPDKEFQSGVNLAFFPYQALFTKGSESDAMGDECVANLSPDGLNRWELDVIEDTYHDDQQKIHMLWATKLSNEIPKTPIDERMTYDPEGNTGLAFSNGAPNTHLWEESQWDFGNAVLVDAFDSPDYDELQSVSMHEMGHILGAGWADDDPIPVFGFIVDNGYEAYSGDENGNVLKPDETPELFDSKSPVDRWSLMMPGTARNFSSSSTRFAFSLDEIHTIDLKHVPSKDEW